MTDDTTAKSPATHSPGALGNGYTLCGYALEGNPGEPEAEPPKMAGNGERITCEQCNKVIAFCRERFQCTVAATMYRRRAGG